MIHIYSSGFHIIARIDIRNTGLYFIFGLQQHNIPEIRSTDLRKLEYSSVPAQSSSYTFFFYFPHARLTVQISN